MKLPLQKLIPEFDSVFPFRIIGPCEHVWLIYANKGIVFMVSTSKLSNMFSITSVFHCFCTESISELTLAPIGASGQGDNTLGKCFLGNQLSSHMSTSYPSPIRHIAPLLMTYVPLSILCQAYEVELRLAASMIVLFGKKFALNTL